jgi:5-methylcytosine-specific restriction protein A
MPMKMHHPGTNTFLFSWNLFKFEWPEIGEESEMVRKGEKVIDSWTCSSHKKIREGDRAFISIVGVKPVGIFASGYVVSEPFKGLSRNNKPNYRVLIDLDVLLDPNKDKILTLDLLQMSTKMAKQLWTPQGSGITINQEITDELEALWQDFLETEHRNVVRNLR